MTACAATARPRLQTGFHTNSSYAPSPAFAVCVRVRAPQQRLQSVNLSTEYTTAHNIYTRAHTHTKRTHSCLVTAGVGILWSRNIAAYMRSRAFFCACPPLCRSITKPHGGEPNIIAIVEGGQPINVYTHDMRIVSMRTSF